MPADVFTDAGKLKAELHTLSYRLRLTYSITDVRDRYASSIRQYCLWGLGLSLVLMLAIIGTQEFVWRHNYFLLNYLIVAFAGLAGAFTSVGRRVDGILGSTPLDDDPIMQASALEQGRVSLVFAFLTGPVFALIMTLVMLGGIVKIEPLTPNFVDQAHCRPPVACGEPDFRFFYLNAWLASYIDGAKLLFLAFLSGFAERFVPDVLDRLTNQGGGKPAPVPALPPPPPPPRLRHPRSPPPPPARAQAPNSATWAGPKPGVRGWQGRPGGVPHLTRRVPAVLGRGPQRDAAPGRLHGGSGWFVRGNPCRYRALSPPQPSPLRPAAGRHGHRPATRPSRSSSRNTSSRRWRSIWRRGRPIVLHLTFRLQEPRPLGQGLLRHRGARSLFQRQGQERRHRRRRGREHRRYSDPPTGRNLRDALH